MFKAPAKKDKTNSSLSASSNRIEKRKTAEEDRSKKPVDAKKARNKQLLSFDDEEG